MKKTTLLLTMLLMAAVTFAKDIKTVVFTTQPQMHCESCENKIKGNLRFEKGIKNIETNVDEQAVTIQYDADKTNEEAIMKAFGKIGYQATKKEAFAQKEVTPKWDSKATPQQRAVITEMISNMIPINGGSIYIGNPANKFAGDNVYDQYRKVTLSYFSLGKYTVRQKEYDIIMQPEEKLDNYSPEKPQTSISWYNCQRFIERLNQLSGLQFRLPTEAEWEYAARGGHLSKGYAFAGSDDYTKVAWLQPNSGDSVHAVGKLQPNELGLFDMTGNVEELVLDCYESHPSETSQPNPFFFDGSAMHTVKGGGVVSNPDQTHLYNRMGINAGIGFSLVGFRLALGNGVQTPKIEYPKLLSLKDDPNEIDTTLIKGVADAEKTQFIRGEQWERVLEEARLRDKLIFVDCYTKWCGPCKTMDKYVFPTKQIGEFMNSRFICAKLDMETPEGKELNKLFQVNSYPTFLIITPEGKVLDRFGGLHNVRNTILQCDSLLSLHPEYDWVLVRNPEPEGIDSTDYVLGRETIVHHLTFKEALSRAKEEGKRLVMLDCSTSWCGHCKIVERRIFPLASVGDLLNPECIVNYMDMDTPEGIALRDKYDIKGYPEFMFFDLDGNLVGRVSGSGSAKVLKRRWRQAMNGINPSYY